MVDTEGTGKEGPVAGVTVGHLGDGRLRAIGDRDPVVRLVPVNTEWNTVAALIDLAALTPPFLVAAAFLIAVGAFVRHEMRAADTG